MDGQRKHLYEFGPFQLDATKRLLLRDGEPIPLTPKAVETLLALVQSHGELVEKEEVMKRLWPDTFVEEGNLAVHISLLRKTLTDDENGHPYIETVPKRGYRFVAEVHERWDQPCEPSAVQESSEDATATATAGAANEAIASPSVPGAVSIPMPGREGGARPAGLRAALLMSVVALLAAGVTLVFILRASGWRNALRGVFAPRQIHSVAVLPLQNLSGDPAQQYFADGMTEQLITDLAQVSSLRVVSRTSVMRYKDTKKSLPEIARELRVDAVVEGSVWRSGDQVRVTAQLLWAANDAHLWAETYDGRMDDILSLQKQVARAIVHGVRAKLTPREQALLAKREPGDPATYELYLQGRYHWNKRSLEGFNSAAEYFRRAIARDPNYARAYAGLADCYTLRALYLLPGEGMPEAKIVAEKALALDESLAEAHTSLAAVKAAYEWDWPGAQQEFRRALELNPNYVTARHWYAVLYLAPMRRFTEALAELERALELDPLSLILHTDLGWVLQLSGQEDRALEQYRKTIEMDPAFIQARFRLFQLYAQKKMYEESLAEMLTDMNLAGRDSSDVAAVKKAYAESGYQGVARWQLETAQKAARQGMPVSAYFLGGLYTGLGEKDLAFSHLRAGLEQHSPAMIYLGLEPSFASLHSDPRFGELLRRIGLPQ